MSWISIRLWKFHSIWYTMKLHLRSYFFTDTLYENAHILYATHTTHTHTILIKMDKSSGYTHNLTKMVWFPFNFRAKAITRTRDSLISVTDFHSQVNLLWIGSSSWMNGPLSTPSIVQYNVYLESTIKMESQMPRLNSFYFHRHTRNGQCVIFANCNVRLSLDWMLPHTYTAYTHATLIMSTREECVCCVCVGERQHWRVGTHAEHGIMKQSHNTHTRSTALKKKITRKSISFSIQRHWTK